MPLLRSSNLLRVSKSHSSCSSRAHGGALNVFNFQPQKLFLFHQTRCWFFILQSIYHSQSAFNMQFLLCSWLYIIQPWPEVKIYQPLNLDFRKRGLWSPWWLLIMPSPPYRAACQERRRRWSSFPPPDWWPRQASTLCNWVDWVYDINSRSGALGVCTLCKCFAS